MKNMIKLIRRKKDEEISLSSFNLKKGDVTLIEGQCGVVETSEIKLPSSSRKQTNIFKDLEFFENIPFFRSCKQLKLNQEICEEYSNILEKLGYEDAVCITVKNQIINSNIVGVGWNIAAVKNYDFTEYAAEKMFEYLLDSNPSYVRLGWDTPVSKIIEGSMFWLEKLNKSDIWTMLANWSARKFAETNPDLYSIEENYPLKRKYFREDARLYGDIIGQIIYDLACQYDVVQGYSVWHEQVGKGKSLGTIDQPGSKTYLNKETARTIKSLDSDMGTEISNRLVVFGLESSFEYRESPLAGTKNEWDRMIADGVVVWRPEKDVPIGPYRVFDPIWREWPSGKDYLHVIAIHEYWSVFDYDEGNPHPGNQGTIQSRLINKAIVRTWNQMNEGSYEFPCSIFFNEIGSYGCCYPDTSNCDNSEPNFSQSLFIAEATIRALQMTGVKGICRWHFPGVNFPHWKTLEYAKIGDQVISVSPVPENYYPNLLIQRSIPRGCVAFKIDYNDDNKTFSPGLKDDTAAPGQTYESVEAQRVWAGSFAHPDGPRAVIVVNDSFKQKVVGIEMGVHVNRLKKLWMSSSHIIGYRINDPLLVENRDNQTVVGDIIEARSINVYCTADHSIFLSQEVPHSMLPGEQMTISITFKNSGHSYWGKIDQNPILLGFSAGESIEESPWGISDINLQSSEITKPNQKRTIHFTIQAPTNPGKYPFQWRLHRQDGQWFGNSSKWKEILVSEQEDIHF